jgi:hypothetical protein
MTGLVAVHSLTREYGEDIFIKLKNQVLNKVFSGSKISMWQQTVAETYAYSDRITLGTRVG